MDILNFTPKKLGLSNNQLKIIAMISMLVDHIGVYLFPDVLILRIIGRIAFPIFAYMIAEGCFYTKHRLRYLLHLLILGSLCQLVYFFFMGSLYMGILLTFSLSIIIIYTIEYYLREKSFLSILLMFITILGVSFISGIMPFIFKEQGFEFDYGILGIFLPVVIYFSKYKLIKLIILTIFMILLAIYYNSNLMLFSLLAIPLLLLYNNERGKYKLKYLFYIFYPLHLVIIYLIDLFT